VKLRFVRASRKAQRMSCHRVFIGRP
jgi:hypothetical protein